MTPESTFTLDTWDVRLIKYFKSNEPLTIRGTKEIWAERNNVEIELIHIADIVSRMLHIIQKLNLLEGERLFDLIKNAHPDSQWKFRCRDNDGDIESNCNYFDNWARALASFLMLTEVKKLKGWPAK